MKPSDNQYRERIIGALLGAACGDALGWPNERATKNRYTPNSALFEFKNWTRRTGGRYYLHEEVISAGEYSDDTQLILALCRSILKNEEWYSHWTRVELPMWVLYQRGGGGATKRAAESWLDGHSPWSSKERLDVDSYFSAGGNGVAMRVLPHIFTAFDISYFRQIAEEIMLDGISTHGHPNALLGALAFGFSAWKSINRTETLEYGFLIDELLANISEWSVLPFVRKSDWNEAAEIFNPEYKYLWNNAVNEIKESLTICKRALNMGALVTDDEILKQLNCFDPKISGSGIVAATCAIFLASRYAADPKHGVIKAAYAFGSDTDTIASMTGGLLGIISGLDWLLPLNNQLQDYEYIKATALNFSNGNQRIIASSPECPITRTIARDWMTRLLKASVGTEIMMPDMRQAQLTASLDYPGQSGQYQISIRQVASSDGQTLYFKKISRSTKPRALPDYVSINDLKKNKAKLTLSLKIPVESIEKSIWFYRDLIGLNIQKMSPGSVFFEQGLQLIPRNNIEKQFRSAKFRAFINLETKQIEECLAKFRNSGITADDSIRQSFDGERAFFYALDPDDNIIEIFQIGKYYLSTQTHF